MSIESRRHQYGTVFDHWQIGELLGASKNGQTAVFHLYHKESSQEESAAKIITLIEEHGNLSEFTPSRRAEYEAELERRKEHALQEVQFMYALKGYTNIVSYEDRVTEHWTEDNSFGCDLLIRMELLRDLRKIIRTGTIFSEREIIQIGMDICTALKLCHGEENPIIHRDIKPENIFVNARGTYKLGDFGVSRILDKCQGSTATTAIGTPAYLAPEQAQAGYDERVDIYSLGVVLYELSNQNRLPFAETVYDTEKAVLLRMAGNKLPAPSNASADLAKIIMKACAFKAEDRYQTAEEMLAALKQLVATGAYGPAMEESKIAEDVLVAEEDAPVPDTSGKKDLYATAPATAEDFIPAALGEKTWGRDTKTETAMLDRRTSHAVHKAEAKGAHKKNNTATAAVAGIVVSFVVAAILMLVLLLPKNKGLKNAKVGDCITFGTYEQDNNLDNGKEEIEWIVLKVQDGKAFVISKKALDCKQYNTSLADVTWETCTLRQWLNSEFMDAAFTGEEKEKIPTVEVPADQNPLYATHSGKATRDKVYLLSIDEVNQYYADDSERMCEPTDYAVAMGAYVHKTNGNCWWSLRTSGELQNKGAGVRSGGDVSEHGSPVDYTNTAVRPVMWIEIE